MFTIWLIDLLSEWKFWICWKTAGFMLSVKDQNVFHEIKPWTFGTPGKKRCGYQRYSVNDLVTHAIARSLSFLIIGLLLKIWKDFQCISSKLYSSSACTKMRNHMHTPNNNFWGKYLIILSYKDTENMFCNLLMGVHKYYSVTYH